MKRIIASMKKLVCVLLSVAMLFSLAACGKDESSQPVDDSTVQPSAPAPSEGETEPSAPAPSEEETRPSGTALEEETEPAKAELRYNTGYYTFEDLNDGYISVRCLMFYDDGTVDYDWATYDYFTVGDFKLEYNGKPIYMVAGPTGDTYSYTVSDNTITIVEWNGNATAVLVLTSDGALRVEQTTDDGFTAGNEYVIQ